MDEELNLTKLDRNALVISYYRWFKESVESYKKTFDYEHLKFAAICLKRIKDLRKLEVKINES